MKPLINEHGRIVGTRCTVYHVLDYLRADWHHTEIASLLRLGTDQVLAAKQFIEEHRDEVMPQYQRMLERDARGNPPEIQALLAKSHEKLMKRLEELQAARTNRQEPANAIDRGRRE